MFHSNGAAHLSNYDILRITVKDKMQAQVGMLQIIVLLLNTW